MTLQEEINLLRSKLLDRNPHRKTLLVFRIGEFYEAFDEDAKIVSAICNISLIKRNNILMSGFPVHAENIYFQKLLKQNYSIAVADIINNPILGEKAIRDITRIICPELNLKLT